MLIECLEAICKDSSVRDLAWVASSPPLIHSATDGYRLLDSKAPEWDIKHLNQVLDRLNDDPSILHDALDKEKDKRLGKYFEALLAFWLQASLRFDLLAKNLPVRENGRTIGEFDFIVRDTERHKTLQLEVALKFYLGIGNLENANAWHGPELRDRLDKKLNRMLQHQARLAHHPAAMKVLSQQGLEIDEVWVLVKGRLFYPHSVHEPGPSIVNTAHLKGWWCELSRFEHSFAGAGLQWRVLRKVEWMAKRNPDATDKNLNSSEPGDYLMSHSPDWPVSVVGFRDGEEAERGFITPNGWPPLPQLSAK